MRGSRRKDIAKYVKSMYGMLPERGLYKESPRGFIILSPLTQRAIIQNIKRNYKKRQRGESIN